MKRCLNCGEVFETGGWECPHCGFHLETQKGFPSFYSVAGDERSSFSEAVYNVLKQAEPSFFWFGTRARLIADLFDKYFPEARSFFDVGCGTGFVLASVAVKRPEVRLAGAEISIEALTFAKERLPGGEFIQADARNIPYAGEFDVAGAFDVIEHVDDDTAVLRELHACLHPGGGIIITVPQHPFLWSRFDVASCHHRRYTHSRLRRIVEDAGFRVERMTSFVTVLFPILVLSRLIGRVRAGGAGDDAFREFVLPRFLNRLFEMVSDIERTLILRGVSFPFGGSLLCVAHKE